MALLKPQSSQTYTPSANQAHSIIPSHTNDGGIPKVSDISLCFSAHSTNLSNSSTVPWILDTRATDHMICSASYFSKIKAEVSYSVALPNGEIVPVTHIGTVKFSESLILDYVLCVPSFSFNLVSARKIAQIMNYCLVFFPDLCIIQDLLTWTATGMGEVKWGLYHLVRKEISSRALVEKLAQTTYKIPITASTISDDVEDFGTIG